MLREKEYEKVKRIAENEMFTKIGNQILQFVKEVGFEEYIRKREEWENKKIQFAENQGIKKANEDLFIKRLAIVRAAQCHALINDKNTDASGNCILIVTYIIMVIKTKG